MKKSILKKIGIAFLSAAMLFGTIQIPQFSVDAHAAGLGEIYKEKGQLTQYEKLSFGRGSRSWYVVKDNTNTVTLLNNPSIPMGSSTITDSEAKLSSEISNEANFYEDQREKLDRLYLPEGEIGANVINAGGTNIALDQIIGSATSDFLVSGTVSDNACKVVRLSSQSVSTDSIEAAYPIVPYTNLNTESVSFYTITDENYTTLVPRFNGNSKISSNVGLCAGTVRVNFDSNDEGKSLSLYVMGNDNGKNWLYVLDLNGKSTVLSSDDIKNAAKNIADGSKPGSISLSEAKIWIEGSIRGIVYAKKKGDTALNVINSSIRLTDITPPKAGEEFDLTASHNIEGLGDMTVRYYKGTYTGTSNSTWITSGKAASGTVYSCVIDLVPATNYTFDKSSISAKINDITASTVMVRTGALRVYCSFPATEGSSNNLKSITKPAAKTITSGVEKTATAMGLPTTVKVTNDEGTTADATVTWDVENCSYDKSKTAEQKFDITGDVSLPSGMTNTNNVSLKTTISITTKGKCATPTSNLTSGNTYTGAQSCTLSTTTSGATIYYTVSESNTATPTTSSTKYTGAFTIEGKVGYTSPRYVKAIAVKDGMVTSAVMSHVYKITTYSSTSTTTTSSSTASTISRTTSTSRSSYYYDDDDEDWDDDSSSKKSTSSNDDDDDDDDWDDDDDDSESGSIYSYSDNDWSSYLIGGFEMLEGEGGLWNAADGGVYMVRGEGELDDFLTVLMDDVEVDSSNYALSEGSTIIEFTPEYLSTIGDGDHYIDMIWTDGSASTYFTVEGTGFDAADAGIVDEFGEESWDEDDGDYYYDDTFYWEDVPIWVWIIAIVVPLIIIAVVIVLIVLNRKKKKKGGDEENPPKEEKKKKEKKPKQPKEPKAAKEKKEKKGLFLIGKKKSKENTEENADIPAVNEEKKTDDSKLVV